MNCREAERRLDEYVDDEIDPATRERMERHLAGCTSCRRSVDRLQELMAQVSALPSPRPPAGLLDAVASRVADEVPGLSLRTTLPATWDQWDTWAA